MAQSGEIPVIRGTTKIIPVTFLDKDSNPIDITGATVFFTVKKTTDLYTTDDSTAVIKETIIEHSNPTAGKTTIQLSPTQTDQDSLLLYFYDIVIKYSDDVILAIRKGNFIVREKVGKRDSA